MFALHILAGAQATWEKFQRDGATEAEMETAIRSYFPAHLGFHTERQKGFYIGKNPEPFFLWGNVGAAGTLLAGAALCKKVRAVLCVPERPGKR